MAEPLIVVDEAIPFVAEALSPCGRVVARPGAAIDAAAVRQADVLVTRSVTRVDAALVEGSRLSLVVTATAGTDHVDTTALARCGIGFASSAGCNAMAVAQYVLAAIALAERMSAGGRADGVRALAQRIGGTDVAAGPVAVVGFGHVGRRLTRLLRACGVTVRVCDPPLATRRDDPTPIDADARYDADARTEPLVPWPDVLDGAAAVTLHVPRTRSGPHPTLHLLDAAALARVPDGALILNTCRGGVVDDAALTAWLAAGRGHAILDVFESEPAVAPAMARATLVTPHIAGYTLEGKLAATRLAAAAVARHTGGSAWSPDAHLPPLPARAIAATPTAILDLLVETSALATDDAALRGILRDPPGPRATAFEALRTGYRLRREHAAHPVTVTPSAPALTRHLTALGFST